MLSSQITIVSRTSNASHLPHRRVANTVIRPSTVRLGRSTRDHQQSRAFRLGFWSSYLDPTFQKEFQRRRRTLQRKYLQAVNRKLAWDGPRESYLRHSDLKGFMSGTWRGHDPRPGGRWVNVDALNTSSSHLQRANSSGIEEVERNALDKLLDHKDAVNDCVRAGSQMLGRGWNTLFMSESNLDNDFRDLSQKSLRQTKGQPSASTFASHYEQDLEYDIDPITNKKVFKKNTSGSAKPGEASEIPVKTFKGYRSQFVEFIPPSMNGPGNLAEKPVEAEKRHNADNANMSILDQPAARHPVFEEYHGTVPDNYKPFRFNEPDGKFPEELKSADPVQESLKDYERLIPNCYEPFRYNEPDGKAPEQPCPVEESLREYDSTSEGYKAFRYNEPDGKPPMKEDPMAESLNEYDNLAKGAYKPFRYNEPDGKPPVEEDPIADSLNEYDSSAKGAYKPFRYNEPDGKPPVKEDPMAESLSEYDNLAKGAYNPFRYNEPDGKPPAKEDPMAKSLNEYDNLAKNAYNSFRYNEPDGQPPAKADPTAKSLGEYEKLAEDSYKPFRYNEPDGQPPVKEDSMAKSLGEYEKLAEDSYKPFRFNEPDGKPAEKPDPLKESLKDYEVFSEGYRPFRYNEPDGRPIIHPDIVENELHGFNKIDTTSYSSSYDATAPPVRLYQPFDSTMDPQFNSFDYASERDKAEDLDLLRPSDVRASSGIAKGPQKAIEDDKLARRRELEDDFMKTQSTRSLDSEEFAAVEKVKNTRKLSQDVKAEYNELDSNISAARSRIDAKIAEIDEGSNTGSGTRKLTGKFVQDFPEEFKASWASKDGDGSLMPRDFKRSGSQISEDLEGSYQRKVESDVQTAERAYIEEVASPDSFARNPNTPRLETSLDRFHAKQSGKDSGAKSKILSDPYSKRPQGLETAYAEECGNGQPIYMSSYESLSSSNNVSAKEASADSTKTGVESKNKQKRKDKVLMREIRDIYEESYGKIDTNHRQGQKSSIETPVESSTIKVDGLSKGVPTIPEQSTVYRILAYDPTMQSISSAETTSVVPDLSTPLTPAEVLLRLSNPTKFFPHFEPLKQQGFEIVSGSGDVLVFRKVRDATPAISEVTITGEVKRAKMRVTNPIDGMTTRPIPATGNFASPTGFVNHDLPLDPTEDEPPFKSNIDVRREEPVFSGKSSWSDDTDRPRSTKGEKRRVRKVLIGATWVAGCTYAVGVVAEFFKTGGVDGKGPKGF
ncbi:hypothetical protein B7463_g5768, partial [Scytalidium lignicola]